MHLLQSATGQLLCANWLTTTIAGTVAADVLKILWIPRLIADRGSMQFGADILIIGGSIMATDVPSDSRMNIR